MRLCAFVVLAVLTTSPALQLRCAKACADADFPDATDVCHHDHAARPTHPSVDVQHACCRDAIPTVTVGAERQFFLTAVSFSQVSLVSPSPIASQYISSVSTLRDAGPPGTFAVPLRI
jgi:hypothetical protein